MLIVIAHREHKTHTNTEDNSHVTEKLYRFLKMIGPSPQVSITAVPSLSCVLVPAPHSG